jgi:hypothetical protein
VKDIGHKVVATMRHVFAVLVLISLLQPTSAQGVQDAEVTPEKISAAIDRAVPLIQKSAVTYTEHRTCFACHHQAVPLLALQEVGKRGLEVDGKSVKELARFTATSLKRNAENYRKGQGQGGRADTAGYALFALSAGSWEPDATTEAVTEYLLQIDRDLDHWKTASNRPPSEASRFTTTYLALRGLQAFGTEKQKDKIDARIGKVKQWVIKSEPKDTEDQVFRLLALGLLRVEPAVLTEARQVLLRLQRPDGGFAQIPSLSSDAYATGSALFALHRAGGLNVSDPAYQRGLRFLIDTQLKDGSWHVKSRSKPFQLYFESGFPHGKDQFISIAASSWATAALAQALPTKQ